jgi:hypothetical protein
MKTRVVVWAAIGALGCVAGCGDRSSSRSAPSAVSGPVAPTTPMVVNSSPSDVPSGTPEAPAPAPDQGVTDRPAALETPTPGDSAVPDADIDKVPAEQDYEDAAEKQIDGKNANAELDKLEREIGK